MKKLKIFLLYSFVISVFLYSLYEIKKYNYQAPNNPVITGKIKKVSEKYIIIGSYLIYTKDEFQIGDELIIKGAFKEPSKNRNFNSFNYQNYLLSQGIKHLVYPDEIKLIRKNASFKNNYKKFQNPYIETLLFGNNILTDEQNKLYRENGLSHLFAVSGMHISIIALVILTIFKKLPRLKYIITSIFLIGYLFLTTFSPSVIRSVFMFNLDTIKKTFNLKIDSFSLLLIVFALMLLYNPYYLYNIGFLYSFTISAFLIKFSYLTANYKNYFVKLFIISGIAFLASIPININNNYTLNLISPFLNLIFVPLLTFILFPAVIFVTFTGRGYSVLNFITNSFEKMVSYCPRIELNFMAMSLVLILITYLVIIFFLKKPNLQNLYVLVIFLIFLYLIPSFNFYPSLTIIDVGQGDSILIRFPFNQANILVDTGGNPNFDLATNTVIPYLKSIGIKKLDFLILTHGDMDHMGAANSLITNFKVDNIITNDYMDNELEEQLPMHTKINNQTIKFGNNYLSLLHKIDSEENNNSIVIYGLLNNYKILLMGDAPISTEDYLLEQYNIKDIDFLKVGHHGSNTSTGTSLIKESNPKYCLISVGLNNWYGHPKQSVLNNLRDCKIYRTDQHGSINIIFKNESFNIKTVLIK